MDIIQKAINAKIDAAKLLARDTPKTDKFNSKLLELYQRKDGKTIDVNYDKKPITFKFTNVRGSGIKEGRNGSRYIRFDIPYTSENEKVFDKYKECYTYLCLSYLVTHYEVNGMSQDDINEMVKTGQIILDSFNIYGKNPKPNEDFSIFITVFKNTRIKGVMMENIEDRGLLGDVTFKLNSITQGSDDQVRLNFQVNEIKLEKLFDKIEKTPIKFSTDLVDKLYNGLK